MGQHQFCASAKRFVVKDDQLVETFQERETLTKHSEKTLLGHLVDEVQAARAVDVTLAEESNTLMLSNVD